MHSTKRPSIRICEPFKNHWILHLAWDLPQSSDISLLFNLSKIYRFYRNRFSSFHHKTSLKSAVSCVLFSLKKSLKSVVVGWNCSLKHFKYIDEIAKVPKLLYAKCIWIQQAGHNTVMNKFYITAKREAGRERVIQYAFYNQHHQTYTVCCVLNREQECTYYKPKMQNYWYFAWAIAKSTASSTQFHAISEGILERKMHKMSDISEFAQHVSMKCILRTHTCVNQSQMFALHECNHALNLRKWKKGKERGGDREREEKFWRNQNCKPITWNIQVNFVLTYLLCFVCEKQLLHCNQANSKINIHNVRTRNE